MLFFEYLNLKDSIESYSHRIEKRSNLVNKLNRTINETKQTQ
ncbi:MAG: hypothetical protein ACJAVD_001142 [Porticoccaceae bacterium]|jgi:hypothetical protein